MAKVVVLGAGGWGCALAIALCGENDVTLWSPFEEEIAHLRANRGNEKLLPGVVIPEKVTLTTSLDCARDCDLVLMVTPSVAVRETARRLAGILPPGKVVVDAAKGIELATTKLLCDCIEEELPDCRSAVLSGPSHAEEVARGVPTTVVAAARDRQTALFVQDVVMNDTLRVYTNDDMVGVQLAGALKNIIAVAAGILAGMGLGDNVMAALITRGLSEIARLGRSLGAKESTFAGLAGIGDLVVTCMSQHSRNRRFGIALGKGMTVEQALEEVGMTVEGYHAVLAARKLALRQRVEMPITEQLYRVLYENADVNEAVAMLMTRPKKHEMENVFVD